MLCKMEPRNVSSISRKHYQETYSLYFLSMENFPILEGLAIIYLRSCIATSYKQLEQSLARESSGEMLQVVSSI